jgi:pimeloyl-ACP methyl ester carboxylesterase
MTRMTGPALDRATRHPARRSIVDIGPLGPDLRAAMRTANARIDALDLAELRTPDGTVRYLDLGDGPPVLLVHGIFGGSDAALRQLRSLVPDGFRLIVPSRFGYLGSSLPAGATPARQADVFADLLNGLGIDEAAVVAVSAGATSALEFARRHRDRVSALALLSPNGPGWQRRRMPYRVARFLWGSDRLMWTIRRHFRERLTRLIAVRPLRAADRARVEAELDGIFPLSRRVDGALFDAFVSNPDINARGLADISTPTLIVHARDDALAPCWGGIALAERIPGARLLVVEDGGHLMLGEHPEVAVAVEALLRSTSD